jgi:hypothetical protein
MNSDTNMRETLVAFLKGGNAYMPFSEVVSQFPEEKINTLFPKGTYAPWHLLEHIRLTQWDILDFIQNPDYKEPSWPDDYWPAKDKKATKKDWDTTIDHYQKDNQALQKIVTDPQTDLFKKISKGTGQTIFREILLVCDHNAYHLGEFAIMRQVMDTWSKGHKK